MTTALIPTLAPALAELVDRLDDAVRTPRSRLDVPHLVGEALRPFLGRPGLLTSEQETGDPNRYRTYLLHVPDDGAYSLIGRGVAARAAHPGARPHRLVRGVGAPR